jgi:hypothetical protein
MAKSAFKDWYVPQERDLCVRRLGDNQYEVSEWKGSLQDGGWVEKKPVSLAELNKFIRIHKFLGTNNNWEYYRPGA